MRKAEIEKVVQAGSLTADVGRRMVLRGMLGLGGTLALSACGTATVGTSGSRLTGGRFSARWLGGGIVELATPDYKQIAYADAWIWNNDHIGDYFEMLQVLSAAGVPVMTTGQSDLLRKGLVADFKKAGLDPAKIVAHGGAGMNFGGVTKHGAMTARLVPAVHSNLAGFPSAGFMLDIGGARVYISGDTDVYGDLKHLGERYQPNVAIVSVGNGPFTQGPEEAALACKWLGVSHAIPVHYAHNPLVRGVEAGEDFRRALAQIAPGIQVILLKPGETRMIQT